MTETNGTTTHAAVPEDPRPGARSPGAMDPLEQETRAAANAFVYLWGKVPRSLRGEKPNKDRMAVLEGYFQRRLGEFEAKKRALYASALLSGGAKGEALAPVNGAEGEEPPSAFHLALRFCQRLPPHKRHLVRLFLDLHDGVHPDDFVGLVEEINDTHCLDCGLWLDDDDKHEDCTAPAEESEDEDEDGEDDGEDDGEASEDDAPMMMPEIAAAPEPPGTPSSP